MAMNMVSTRPRTIDVFVGNLPAESDESVHESIKELFSQVAEVHSVIVKEGKNNSNYCFVKYYTQEAADNAIAELNGKFFHGKTLMVKPSLRKGNKPDGGGGGGQRSPVDGRSYNQGQPRGRAGGGKPFWGDNQEWKQWNEETVAMTHVADCTTFYAQRVNEEAARAYGEMIQQLHSHCPTAPKATNLQLNQLYGGVYSQDECWYRCTVLQSSVEPGMVTVRFVDFGNEEIMNSAELVELTPELCATKVFALRLSLHGLDNAFADKTSENAQQAHKYLSNVAEAESVTVKVPDLSALDDSFGKTIPAVLFYDENNINQYIRGTYSDKEPPQSPSPIPHSGGFQHMERPNNSGHNYSGWNSTPHMGGGGDADMIMIQLQGEKAELLQKLHNMKLDLEVVKSSSETEVKAYRDRLEQALNFKISSVFSSLKRVHKARNLYPVNNTKKGPLEEAVSLVLGGEVKVGDAVMKFREATPNVNEVEKTLMELQDCQNKLKVCDSKEALPELILERNEGRRAAFQSMNNFLKVSDQLPIDDRLASLRTTLEAVKAQYPAMVEPIIPTNENPQEVYQQYSMWMDLKMKKLKLYWSETDACLDAWTQLLSRTTHAFSLDIDTSLDDSDMDQILQNLYIALETELVVTCLGYSPEVGISPEVLHQRQTEESLEQDILRRTVQALISDIQSEVLFLGNLSTHCKLYKEKAEDLENWLNDKPGVEELQALQKKIKMSRSKLRHFLADLKDGEEDPDLLGDKTVDQLKSEIGGVQQQLWDYYMEEDKDLGTLASLTKAHFPELPLMFPNLGLNSFMDTNGLLREGRDLKQFDLSPLPMCDKNSVKVASISSKPLMLLKSHHVSDDHAQKSLLSNILSYHAIESPYLLPISGVNYQKDLSNMVIQLQYHPLQSLSHIMTGDEPLSIAELLPILKTVLLGIQSLHDNKVLHCAVHPNNIILKSRSEALLADYDLSKTTVDRAKHIYTAANGLCFTAPEINCGLDPGPATDVFAFGVLVLWAHYPTSPFQTSPDGTPHLDGLPIPQELCTFLAPLLNYNPNKRPQIADILAFGYFDRLPEPPAPEPPTPEPPVPEQFNSEDVENHFNEEVQGSEEVTSEGISSELEGVGGGSDEGQTPEAERLVNHHQEEFSENAVDGEDEQAFEDAPEDAVLDEADKSLDADDPPPLQDDDDDDDF